MFSCLFCSQNAGMKCSNYLILKLLLNCICAIYIKTGGIEWNREVLKDREKKEKERVRKKDRKKERNERERNKRKRQKIKRKKRKRKKRKSKKE